MFRRCCVPACESERKDVKLHGFPLRKELRAKWLKCFKDESVAKMGCLNNVFVCHKHFEKRFITAKNRLKMEAYPSLFTDLEIETGIPTHSFCTESGRYPVPLVGTVVFISCSPCLPQLHTC